MTTTTTPAVTAEDEGPQPPDARRRTPTEVLATSARYVALVISAVLFLLPFYLIVRNALAADSEITAPGWTLFPKTIHWDNFRELFTDPSVNLLQALGNSAIVAVTQTAGMLLL